MRPQDVAPFAGIIIIITIIVFVSSVRMLAAVQAFLR